MRAKFSDLTYTNSAAGKSCDAKEGAEAQPWMTPEHIAVKGTYTASDLEGMEHLNYAAGIAPFLRGPYSTMYVMRPWTDPSVRRFLDRRGVERVLPPQPRFGTEGTVRRVRPGHAPRLRRRPSARRGRRGQSGRVDLLGRGYESAVRRHSARQDVRLDDDERRRAARTGVLHRGGARAGCARSSS